jgi:recombination protein RecT
MSTTQLAKTQEGFLGMLQDPRMISEVQKVCPSFLDPIKLFRIATNQFKSTPKLQRCDPTSLMNCLMDSAVCGLIPDGKYAHMVPYGSTATFLPDWKGLVMLGMKSPDLKRWRTDVVCDGDVFSHDRGRILHHTWDIAKPRGDILGFYSEVVYTSGEEDFEFCTLSEAKGIQKRSAAGGSGPWQSDFSEMGRKTALKRHAKRLGHLLTKEFEEALERDYDNLPNAKDVTAQVSQDATEHLKRLKDTAPESTSASEGQDKVEEVVVDPVPIAEPDEDDIPMDSTPPPGPTDSSSLIRSIIGKLQKHKGKSAIETGQLRNKRLQEVAGTIPDIEDIEMVTTVTFKNFPASILELINEGLGD